MKLNIGTKIYAGYLLAIIIIVIFGVIAYRETDKLLADSKRVTHRNEIKNDISSVLSAMLNAETGQRGYLITGEEKYLENYFAGRDSIYLRLKKLQNKLIDNDIQSSRVIKLKPLIDLRLARLEDLIQIRKSKGFADVGSDEMMVVGKKKMDDIRAVLTDMKNEEDRLLIADNASMEATNNKTNATVFLGLPLGAIVLALIGFLITRNITTPLRLVTRTSELIAEGDLSGTITNIDRSDELGVMMRSFNKMIKMLREQNQEILKGVNVIASTSSQIIVSTTQIAASSAETAAAISETSTTVEEVQQAAKQSAQKAKNVADSAQRLAQVFQNGQKAVDETATGMNSIRQQMDSIAQTIVRLSEQSQSIGGIIASVTDIADQSNLLAVNAAIEAAKAGEQGKGFAVVAQEIKNLAGQSKQATLQVRNILNDVQKATSAAVMATEQGSKAVEAGVKQSAQAGEAIRILSESSNEAVQAAIQIVASSQQQVIGIDQVGVAMQNINQAGTEISVSMVQSEKSAKNLNELGQKLKELVEQFKM